MQVSRLRWMTGDESVMLVEDGKRVVNAVPYEEGQVVVAKRYILEQGEMIIGYPIILNSIF